MELTTHLCPVGDIDSLELAWREVERSAPPPPFLSWTWTRHWARHALASNRLYFIECREGPSIVGVGLFVVGLQRRLRGVLRTTVIRFGETGAADLDQLTAEYCGLLVRPGYETRAYRALFKALAAADFSWDESRISATLHGDAVAQNLPASWRFTRDCSRDDYFVDLEWLRASGKTCDSIFSSSIRSKIRKSREWFRKLGPLRIESAATAEEAKHYLAELRKLHQSYWTDRGEAGAFGSGFFTEFHEGFLDAAMASGEAELLRICAGDAVLGYQYNLCSQGRTYYYVSGVDYGSYRQQNPGYLMHSLLIQRALESGHTAYHFMAGNQDYKRQLSSHVRRVDWLRVQKPQLIFWAEKLYRAVMRKTGAQLSTARAGCSSGPKLLERLRGAGYVVCALMCDPATLLDFVCASCFDA